MPKSTPTRKDIKVKVRKYTKPRPYIISQQSEDVGTGLCIFTYLHIYILPCWCTFWHAMHCYISNDFSVLFLYIFWQQCSQLCCDVNTIATTTLHLETILTVQKLFRKAQACKHIQLVWTPHLLQLTTQVLVHLAFMPQTFIPAFESLEYIIHVSCQGLYMTLYKNPLSRTMHIY